MNCWILRYNMLEIEVLEMLPKQANQSEASEVGGYVNATLIVSGCYAHKHSWIMHNRGNINNNLFSVCHVIHQILYKIGKEWSNYQFAFSYL